MSPIHDATRQIINQVVAVVKSHKNASLCTEKVAKLVVERILAGVATTALPSDITLLVESVLMQCSYVFLFSTRDVA